MAIKNNLEFIVLGLIVLIALAINLILKAELAPAILYECNLGTGCVAVYKFKTLDECKKHLTKDSYCTFIMH